MVYYYEKRVYKSSTYDIKLAIIDNKNSLKENIILEMQRNKPNYDIKRRISYYHHKLGTYSQLKGNADYKSINTISIFILNFNIYDDNICMKEFMTQYIRRPRIRLNNDKVFTIELKKINDLENGKLKKWLEIITSNKLEGLKGKNKSMNKAIDMIEIMNGDQAFLEILEAEDKKERDYQANMIASKKKGILLGKREGKREGRREGREEGILLGKLEVAKSLLQNNVNVEIISLSTGLSIEQINKLK